MVSSSNRATHCEPTSHGLYTLATSDAHVVALEMKTGRLVWERQIADLKLEAVSGGPLVAKGVVMQGTLGRAPFGQYIVGLDAETGKSLWRFNSIAQPGESHGNS